MKSQSIIQMSIDRKPLLGNFTERIRENERTTSFNEKETKNVMLIVQVFFTMEICNLL